VTTQRNAEIPAGETGCVGGVFAADPIREGEGLDRDRTRPQTRSQPPRKAVRPASHGAKDPENREDPVQGFYAGLGKSQTRREIQRRRVSQLRGSK
jgi:hypothetical protein